MWWALPALVFLSVCFFAPVALFLAQAVWDHGALTIAHLHRAFADPVYIQVTLLTFRLAAIVTVVSCTLGYVYALLIQSAPPRRSRVLVAFILLPFGTSLLVRTFAWLILLQRTGVINTFLLRMGVLTRPLPLVRNATGVIIGMTYMLLPYTAVPIYAALRRIDPTLSWSATSLGAPPWRRFVSVTLPLSMPGVVVGAGLVFVLSLGFYITPALLGGARDQTLALLIAQQINTLLDWNLAAVLALMLLMGCVIAAGVTAILWWWSNKRTRRYVLA